MCIRRWRVDEDTLHEGQRILFNTELEAAVDGARIEVVVGRHDRCEVTSPRCLYGTAEA